jgi:hypothetical protein
MKRTNMAGLSAADPDPISVVPKPGVISRKLPLDRKEYQQREIPISSIH